MKHQRLIWIALLATVAAATLVTFWPAVKGEFLSWDDEPNIKFNDRFRGFGVDELKWMFTTLHGGHYQPLAWFTFAIDNAIWEHDPRGYHLTNILLHAVTAVIFCVLVYSLLRIAQPRLADRPVSLMLGAGTAALVFALHPLRVESVAWATERRDVLSGLFYIAATVAYVRSAVASRRGRWLVLTYVLFLLAMLAKVMSVTLPIVLLVLDAYPLRRFNLRRPNWREAGRCVAEKIPLLLVGVVFGVMAILAQRKTPDILTLAEYGIAPRTAQALYSAAFYVWKTLIPLALSPLYELPPNVGFGSARFAGSAIAVVVVAAVLIVQRRRWPGALAAAACYVIILAPVSGLAQNGPQLTADRYSYLSCMPWAVLIGGGVAALAARAAAGPGKDLGLLYAVAPVFLIATVSLADLTRRQIRVWSNSTSLWQRTLAVEPDSYTANVSLGALNLRAKRPDAAVPFLRRALEKKPHGPKARLNLSIAYLSLGAVGPAWAEATRLAQEHPNDASAWYQLGTICARRGDYAKASEYMAKALDLDPDQANLQYDLAVCLSRLGRVDEAVSHLQAALKIAPNHEAARRKLAQLTGAANPGRVP